MQDRQYSTMSWPHALVWEVGRHRSGAVVLAAGGGI